MLVVLLLLLVIGCSRAEEPTATVADYDQAVALDPQDAEAYYNRGNAYLTKGDLDHAEDAAQRAPLPEAASPAKEKRTEPATELASTPAKARSP
jgi:tetratricopeptide (TPR) repeat protein